MDGLLDFELAVLALDGGEDVRWSESVMSDSIDAIEI